MLSSVCMRRSVISSYLTKSSLKNAAHSELKSFLVLRASFYYSTSSIIGPYFHSNEIEPISVGPTAYNPLSSGSISNRLFSTNNKDESFSEGKKDGTIAITLEDDEEEKGQSSSSSDGEGTSEFTHPIKLKMPDLLANTGDDIARVVKWHKKEGDFINNGDNICDVETNAFVFTMDSDDKETTLLGEICVPAMPDGELPSSEEGDTIEGEDSEKYIVKHGTTLCVILHKSDPTKQEKN